MGIEEVGDCNRMAALRIIGTAALGLAVVAGSFWTTLKILDAYDTVSSTPSAPRPPVTAPAPRRATFARVEDWKKSEGNATLTIQRDDRIGRDVLAITGTGGFVTSPIAVQRGARYFAKIAVKGVPPGPAAFSYILLGADNVAPDGQLDLQMHQHSQIANRNAASPADWTEFEVEWRVPPSMNSMAIYVSRDATSPGSLLFRVIEFARR
jgi:hypothetical protein